MALLPCTDTSAADWIAAGSQPWHELVCFGPADFPAYARLRFLPDPAYDGQGEADADVPEDLPSESEQLRTVLETLGHHTRTPDDCYFLLWDGWSSDLYGGGHATYYGDGPTTRGPQVAPAFPPSVLNGPKVAVPERCYFLFRGALSDCGDWGAADMWPGQPRIGMPDPAFIWPADHAWCIADDVDPHWAGIGAGIAAVNELLRDARVDVVPANPRENQPSYT